MNNLCKMLLRMIDASENEEALHSFLVDHPVFLNALSPSASLIVSKPAISPNFLADFALRTAGNAYFWHMVELERSNQPIFTKQGLPSRTLNTAFTQVTQWNLESANPGSPFYGPQLSATIVVGSRRKMSKGQLRRLEAFNLTWRARVVTWETLVDPLMNKSDKLVRQLERETFRVITDAQFRKQAWS